MERASLHPNKPWQEMSSTQLAAGLMQQLVRDFPLEHSLEVAGTLTLFRWGHRQDVVS